MSNPVLAIGHMVLSTTEPYLPLLVQNTCRDLLDIRTLS